MAKAKINKQFIKGLPSLGKGKTQVLYWDSALPGFGLRVGKTKMAFFCEKRIQGITRRYTLGSYPQITPEFARGLAKKTLSKMTVGLNPIDEKRAEKNKNLTLHSAFNDFLENRNSLKDRTVSDYKRTIRVAFKEWENKRLVDINRDMISLKHKQLFKNQGPAQANQHMRVLRAIFNYAQSSYYNDKGKPLIIDNPITTISKKRSWYKVPRRNRVIPTHKLNEWYEAVNNLPREVTKDFLLTLLLTGMRRSEAARLKIEDVCLEEKYFKVTDPKNSKPLQLPLPRPLFDLFKRRIEQSNNDYLFPGDGKNGFLQDPKRAVQSVIKSIGVKFSCHDIRRTYITVASNIVTEYQLKLLVNHSTGGDVTAGYVIPNLEQLREPMGKVTSKLMRFCIKEPAKIMHLNRA